MKSNVFSFPGPLPWLTILLLVAACTNQGKKAGTNNSDFSAKEEILIGSAILNEMMSDPQNFPFLPEDQYPSAYKYLRDSILPAVVNTPALQRRIELDWNIYILQDETVENAFILPGGYILVYTGLLKFLESNHELMGLLAHEVAYADGDFALKQLISKFGSFSINQILNRDADAPVGAAARFFKTLIYRQDEVLHADLFAIDLLCPFQYSPFGIVDILQRAESTATRLDWIERRDAEIGTRVQKMEESILGTPSCTNDEMVKLTKPYLRLKNLYLP